MSLKLQTINVMTHRREQLSCTMPAEHIYPFIVHRSVAEYLEKKDGERTRYSKKHILTHLLTGAQIGVFGRYEHALIVARKLKNKPIFLMPTYDLLTTHPDVPEVGVVVRELKRLYAID